MAYIGSTPTSQNFTSGTDYFSGTGSQTAFTLTRTVNSVNDIEVVINNVVQQPSTAYTLSGTTITFTSAPSSGTNNIYVRYLATNMQSFTVPNNSITRNQLDSNLQAGFQGRNKIINGHMVVDQRNAGASVNPTDGQFITDRWAVARSQASKLTAQQNAGSVVLPIGFSNYLGIASSSAYSITSSDYFFLFQKIEGFNTADLGWGTANAKTVTLSFQVYSSLTGTFGGSIQNYVQNRAYPFTFTVSSANTWTSMSVTVAGDTSGTWVGATNGTGAIINFGLGVGSTYSASAGSWQAGQFISATGATSVVGTSGATFYITGVQLEEGTTATSFERESYSTTLQKCQRYLPSWNYVGSGNQTVTGGFMQSTTNLVSVHQFPTFARTAPTGVTVVSGSGSMNSSFSFNGSGTNPTAAAFYYGSTNAATISWTITGATQWQPTQLYCTNSGSIIYFTGCEL
jgi:hypothetical protein